jgi:hypothetical protein
MKREISESFKTFMSELEGLSLEHLGKISYQTIVFIYFEKLRCIEKSQDFLPSEKSIRKYMLWQSKVLPFVTFMKEWNKYIFDHENDLTWNECLKIDTLFRKQHEKDNQPTVITFEELAEDEVYNEMITLNPLYIKVESGYVYNGK